MLTMDGIVWDVPCRITRVAEIAASDISGIMLDKSYFNDVLGTYLQYDIELTAPLLHQDRHAALFEALSNPVDAHTFVLPYNNDTVELTARVESVEDEREEMIGGFVYWKGLRFTVIANHPTKTVSLGEAVTAGRSPLPSVAEPEEGDSYTYTSAGWVPAQTYDDADDIYY